MKISKPDDNTVVITKETKKETKTFSSLAEAKEYLKTTGLKEEKIQEVEKVWNAGGGNKAFSTTTITSDALCPRCKRPTKPGENRCSYCGASTKMSWWKKLFGGRGEI